MRTTDFTIKENWKQTQWGGIKRRLAEYLMLKLELWVSDSWKKSLKTCVSSPSWICKNCLDSAHKMSPCPSLLSKSFNILLKAGPWPACELQLWCHTIIMFTSYTTNSQTSCRQQHTSERREKSSENRRSWTRPLLLRFVTHAGRGRLLQKSMQRGAVAWCHFTT